MLYAEHRKWPEKKPNDEDGVIVGADLSQEWLLPWWWGHYSRFNSHPVAFADFGMSDEMKNWCKARGTLVNLPVADIFVAERNEMNSAIVQQMEEACGTTFWNSRNAWFKKPLACLKSPFSRSIWIDLDCEIRGSIRPLFSFSKPHIAMAKEPPPSLDYNSGVIVFKHGSSFVEEWADQAFENNHLFRGDQDILNEMIRTQRITITELPSIYNWSRILEENPEAVILHWHGPHGKTTIAHQIARENLNTLC